MPKWILFKVQPKTALALLWRCSPTRFPISNFKFPRRKKKRNKQNTNKYKTKIPFRIAGGKRPLPSANHAAPPRTITTRNRVSGTEGENHTHTRNEWMEWNCVTKCFLFKQVNKSQQTSQEIRYLFMCYNLKPLTVASYINNLLILYLYVDRKWNETLNFLLVLSLSRVGEGNCLGWSGPSILNQCRLHFNWERNRKTTKTKKKKKWIPLSNGRSPAKNPVPTRTHNGLWVRYRNRLSSSLPAISPWWISTKPIKLL